MKSQKKNRDLVRVIASSAAAALILGAGGSAMAAYTGTTTFQEVSPAGGPYPMDDAANWTNGLPDATKLAILGPVSAPPTVPSPMTAYSFEFASDFGFSLSGQPITLTSTDSVYDTTAMTAPALYYSPSGVGEFQPNNNLILGDGSVATGTAYVKNDSANRLIIGGAIHQAPGTTWGLTLLPTVNPTSDLYRFRANNNGGNYLTNRYTFTGPFTLEGGAVVRAFNNVLPYGPGLPNTVINGEFRHSQNRATILFNAIDGTGEIDRNAGNDIAIGANNGNGSFSGVIINGSTRLHKIGSGTQTLSNAANSYSSVALINGVLSVDSIADSGVDSALGEGDDAGSVTIGGNPVPLAATGFDGGTLRYTGAGHTSNRELGVSFRGGNIEASGSGAVVINGAVNSNDLAMAFGDNVESGSSQTVTNMYGVEGLGALASQLTIVDVSGFNDATYNSGVYNVLGTSPESINETNRTMLLASVGADGVNPAVNGVPGSGMGAPRFVFQSETGLDRTLTLGGTSTADNTLGGAISDSPLGGKLNIAKSGTGTWVLSGGNTYTGTTSVNGGTLAVTASAIPAGNAISVNSGGTYEMRGAGSAFDVDNLTVNSGGTAVVQPTGTGTNVLLSDNFLLSGTGKLDLTDNKLITSKDPGTADATGTYTGLQRDVQRAYNFTKWDQPGLMTSKADAKAGLTTIGISTGKQIRGLSETETAMWGGQTITGASTLAMYTYAGDANLDGQIDAGDYGIIDNFVQIDGASGYGNGDFNYDGFIDAGDYGIIDNNIQAQTTPFSTSGSATALGASGELSGVTAVPEPASLSVIALAAASLLGRRRRQQ